MQRNQTPRATAVITAFVAIVLGFGACASMEIRTDFDDQVDFAKYETYRWDMKQTRDRKEINSLLDMRIRRAINEELAAKGLRHVEAGADVVVAYRAGIQEKVDVTTTWYGWRNRRRAVETDRYKEGTIIVDLIDPGMKQLVWRGAAVGVIDASDRSQEKVADRIAKIFAHYPPVAR